jgi:hypothetical protein
MATLEKRIAELEKTTSFDCAQRIWLIRLVPMGQEPQPLKKISHKGQTWHILPGESEEAFTDRVKAEALAADGETGVILLTT